MSKSNVQNIEIVDSNFEANALEISKKTSKTIPVDYKLLIPHEYNKIFKEGRVEEMKESIKEIGLQQPIVVFKVSDKYKILSGHTRYEAIKQIIEEKDFNGYVYQNKIYFQEIPVNVIENIDDNKEMKILIETNTTQRSLTNKEKRECARMWAKIYDDNKLSLKLTNKKKFVAGIMGISDKTAQRVINEERGKINNLSEIDKFIKKIESTSRLIRAKSFNSETCDEKQNIKLCIEELKQEIDDAINRLN